MSRQDVMVQTENGRRHRIIGGLSVFIIVVSRPIISVLGENRLPNCDVHPFNFQCFEVDVCKFPDEYCSSAKHERHCKPCHERLCGNSPPLQCAHFCSNISLQQQHGQDSLKTASATSEHACYSENWMIVAIIESVVLVLAAILIPVLWRCCQRRRDAKRKLRPSMMTQTSRTPDNENVVTKQTGPATACPADDKLKKCIPTSDQNGKYHPTTAHAKDNRTTEDNAQAPGSLDSNVHGVESSVDDTVLGDNTGADGTGASADPIHATLDEETPLMEVVTGEA